MSSAENFTQTATRKLPFTLGYIHIQNYDTYSIKQFLLWNCLASFHNISSGAFCWRYWESIQINTLHSQRSVTVPKQVMILVCILFDMF